MGFWQIFKPLCPRSHKQRVKAAQKYLGNSQTFISGDTYIEKNIIVKSIKDVVINGNTYYYLTDTSNNKYRINININEFALPFINENANIKVYYAEESDVKEIIKIEK